ncbi:MAG: NINE protein, partial [Thermoanaerobaculia bacterium]
TLRFAISDISSMSIGNETETRNLSLSVPSRLRKLDLERRRQFELQFQRHGKSEDTTAVLLWCLGFLGAHRFYLGQPSVGAVFLSGFVLGVFCLVVARSAHTATFAAIGVTVLFIEATAVVVEIVRHESITKKANLVVKDRVLRELEDCGASERG